MLRRRASGAGLVLFLAIAGCGPAKSDDEPGVCEPTCVNRACGASDRCGGTCTTGCVPEQPSGMIAPLYVSPGHAAFEQLASSKAANPAVPVIAVVNPDTGPGAARSDAFAQEIDRLADEGIVVAGYVPTAWGARPASDVEADVRRYREFYPRVRLIFFDEMQNWAGGEEHYRGLSQRARQLGFERTIGNPGADTLESYVGTVDVLVIHGGEGVPDYSRWSDWYARHDRNSLAILSHSVETLAPDFVSTARQHVGQLFATDDVQPNPWDGLPSYLDGLFTQLR